ncbi:MAG: hypothetical protein KatS3mg031_1375 [Chitinophagales bacterium]|nr:MAG: hypothetical protein KatS3mg031_1375 [Chitinophagales bacterium]
MPGDQSFPFPEGGTRTNDLKRKKRNSPFDQLRRALTSAALLIPAYIIAYALQQYVTGVLCLLFGYEPIINYNRLDNLPFDYRQWSVMRVTLIFSAGPLACFIAGLFFLDLFNSLKGQIHLSRLFVLWLGICNLNVFLGFLLFSPFGVGQYHSPLYQGFAIVGTWWRLNTLLMTPLAALSGGASLLVGHKIVPAFLKFSFSYSFIHGSGGRRKMLLQLYLVPLAMAIPALLLLPDKNSFAVHAALLMNLLLIGVGAFIQSGMRVQDTRVSGADVLNTFPWLWFILASMVYSAVWLFLR